MCVLWSGIPCACTITTTMQTCSSFSKSSHPSDDDAGTKIGSKKKRTRKNAHWDTETEEKLLVYLCDEPQDGGGYKPAAFSVVAHKLNAELDQDNQKSLESCRNKWVTVCILFV